MENILSGRAAVLKNPLCTVIDGKGKWKRRKFLGNVFGELPTELFKAANLNLSFDDSEIKFGTMDQDGNFDGVIGLLQRNESDFSAFGIALESFRGHFDIPVKVISLTYETKYYSVTNPTYNRTIIQSDIEDSALTISPMVFLFYFILYLIFYALINNPAWKIPRKLINRSIKRIKNVAWKMVRIMFRQGIYVKFPFLTQSYLYLTIECAVGMLISLYFVHFSAELVSYTKPHLLDTLEDILEAPEVKITFTEAANIAAEFKNSPAMSVKRKLYERSLSQWDQFKNSVDENGKLIYFHLLPSDRMLEVPSLIKKHKMALLASHLPIGMILGLECKNIEAILKGEEWEEPLKYSSLHVSRESFTTETSAILASRKINPELEHRLTKYYQRLSDHGLNQRILSKGAEEAIESIPIGKPLSSLCLHFKEWNHWDKVGTTSLRLESCRRFLLHISMAILPSLVFLVLEIMKVRKPKKKISSISHHQMVRPVLIFSSTNKYRLQMIRKRRMEEREKRS